MLAITTYPHASAGHQKVSSSLMEDQLPQVPSAILYRLPFQSVIIWKTSTFLEANQHQTKFYQELPDYNNMMYTCASHKTGWHLTPATALAIS
jgi:hypothetical protein